MKRCLAFLIFFLVAWQLASSQGVVDHGLNGDIRPVQPHQGTVFDNNAIHENVNVKIHEENIPERSLSYAGDINQLPKPVEDIAKSSTGSIPSLDNGQTISPKETSTATRAPNVAHKSTMHSIGDGQIRSPKETLTTSEAANLAKSGTIHLVDNGQTISPKETFTATREPNVAHKSTMHSIGDGQNRSPKETLTTSETANLAKSSTIHSIDNGQMISHKEASTTTKAPNIAQRGTHPNQLVDSGQKISPKETSTSPPNVADKITMQSVGNLQTTSSKETSTGVPLIKITKASLANTHQGKLPEETPFHVAQSVHHIQPVDNVQNSNPGASNIAKNIETPFVGSLYDDDRKGTPTSIPGITPAPIFMLDASQLKKPSMEFQSTTKMMQGESTTQVPHASSTIEQEVSTVHEKRDEAFTTYSGEEFTSLMPNKEQKVSTDDKKNDAVFIPYHGGEPTNPILKLEQEINIPPTPVPGLYSHLKTRHFKIRRKKRSTDDERRQTDCEENVSMFPKSYIWGIIGWACFIVLLWLYFNEKLSIWARLVKFCTRRRNQNPEDIESGPQTHPEENKEIKIYEKKGRSPSGYGIVNINKDFIELIDESYLTQAVTVENMDVVIDKATRSNFEMEGIYRRASEKVKVIRRLSSTNGCSSLEDQILLAKEVINDNVAGDGKVSEKRKVIREATANERKGSLQEEIEFARSVILPSDVVKEQDEDALHRRQQIKAQTSGRRTSLLEEINVAKEVLGIADDVAP